ncbi:MAG TPA: L-threonine dehydrogenase [Lentisphaeria bacterium]|nr:MAG: L-threonine dehydrogenase [Lentisphaerae bacterium GWF2_38_69]HBM16829.1 L-threonine dehydrogenase [Lentisphaeria bacterium]
MSVGRETLKFFIPCVSIMGVGSHTEVPSLFIERGCKKPLIVTDKMMTQLGVTQQFIDLMKKVGITPIVYDETVPNPTDNNVMKGVDVYKGHDCDSIMTLGGGSPHDCGKGIGIVVTNGGIINDYEGVDKSKNRMPPFIAVNTTAGTASEMTRFCIITDTKRHVKMAIVDWRTTPDVAVNDPELMVGMPPSLTAATGMDALTHAVEAYVSIIATPITDSCAFKAIELISQNLRAAVAFGKDMVARDKMAYAEYLAGMAFNNASLGYVHAMAHQLGGLYNLPHGVCNAILLPHICKFNLIAKVDRFADIARAMGLNIEGVSTRRAADMAIEAIQQLSRDVGIPANLTQLGVKEQDLKTMSENAQKDACSFTNPRTATLQDIINIYKGAL